MTVRPLFAALLLAPAAVADGPSPAQRDRQRESMAAAEQTARRLTTSLRVLAYQKLEPTAEQRSLEEVAGGLRQLGRQDMAAVLAHLENAVAAPDPATATAEQRQAYQKHRQIVTRLRSLLAKADAVGGLDEAARKLVALGKGQHELYLRSAAAERATDDRPGRRGGDIQSEAADAQQDLKTDFAAVAGQLQRLAGKLTPEQQARLAAADAPAKAAAAEKEMTEAQRFAAAGQHRQAASVQLRAAREVQALAAALADPGDPAAALKAARDKVEQARAAQEKLALDTAAEPDLGRPRGGRGTKTTDQRRQEHAAGLAERQSRLEFQTRDARKALEAAAADLAPKLGPAESEMRRAEDDLRQTRPDDATKPQVQAAERLAGVRDELDKRLAAAEKEKADPLAATKRLAEAAGQLAKEQAAAKKKAEAATTPDEQKAAAAAQTAIARKAEAIKAGPLPKSTAAKQALDAGTKAAGQAAADLDRKQQKDAAAQQAAAQKGFEEAKAALEAHAKAIEKRQGEIGGLEKGLKDVGDLAEREAKLAADAAAGKPGDQLAAEQADVANKTQAAADALKEIAPEAAGPLAEAAAKEQAAARDFVAGKPQAGAEKARAAQEKLQAAQKALGQKLSAIASKQIGEQGDKPAEATAAAAQQVAKAIEQAEQASEAAKQAGEPLDAAKSLADAQKQLAESAAGPAKTPAAEAGAALEAGNLSEAVAAQKAAADKFGATPAGDRQRSLQAATEKLLESAQATAAAQATVAQAQANTPEAVKGPLADAAKSLGEAQSAATKGEPAAAGSAQTAAATTLRQALQALNAAAEAAGLPTSQPGEAQTAQAAKPGEPGDKPGEPGDQPGQPGDQPGGEPGQQPSDQEGGEQEKNGGQANGDRRKPGTGNRAKPQGRDQAGTGSFINLQKIDREKVQQAAEAAFPAVFRELIKQYHINVKKAADRPQPKK